MARIRNTETAAQIDGRKCTLWRVAAYIRLSRDDGNDESLSVTNQRKIILEFMEERFGGEDCVLSDFYIDDGRSGTTEDTRPEFQRMVGDIESGSVNCVICKTLSRCFRNYSDQGRFLEQFVPAHKCRFIAISNPFVDTFADPECTQNMEIPINGLMNDRFAAKTSADIRRTFDTKRRRGEFIGAFAPYGYQKDPKDKNALVIDEDAAEVVRDIFRCFVRDGMNKSAIAKRLNALGILNPSAYKRSRGLSYRNPHAVNNDGMWNPKTLGEILKNPVYTGTMVQGRQGIVSYKVHKRINNDQEDWYVVEGTHEPIIDKALFEKARELLKRDTRTAPGKKRLYLFSGLLRCADCGKAMVRNTTSNYVYYACRTYREKSKDRCTKHSIRQDCIEAAVLAAVQAQIALAPALSKMVEEINAAPAVHTEYARLNALMKQKARELERITGLLDGLYLDMKSGDLSRDQYRRMKERFEKQISQLQDAAAHIREECDAAAHGTAAEDPYLTAFLKHHNIQRLERGLLVELVSFIHIHENGFIEIEFNCEDQFRRIAELSDRRELYGSGDTAGTVNWV